MAIKDIAMKNIIKKYHSDFYPLLDKNQKIRFKKNLKKTFVYQYESLVVALQGKYLKYEN